MAHADLSSRSQLSQLVCGHAQELHEGLTELLLQDRFDHPETARAAFDALDGELRAQLALEEQLILPAYELEAHEPAEKLRAEHKRLRQLLDKVASDLDQRSLSRGASHALLTLLREHSRHDAQRLLPWVDECLPRRAKTRILERQQALVRG